MRVSQFIGLAGLLIVAPMAVLATPPPQAENGALVDASGNRVVIPIAVDVLNGAKIASPGHNRRQLEAVTGLLGGLGGGKGGSPLDAVTGVLGGGGGLGGLTSGLPGGIGGKPGGSSVPGQDTYNANPSIFDTLYFLVSTVPQAAQTVLDLAGKILGLNISQAREAIGYASTKGSMAGAFPAPDLSTLLPF